MPVYDRTWFEPPAPLARVTIRSPDTGETVTDVSLLLDSGSDVSLVPRDAADKLGITALPGRYYELVGFDGSQSLARVVRLEILFCRRVFRGQYLLVEQPWGILGRNVLNALSLVLDGPNLAWDEYRPG